MVKLIEVVKPLDLFCSLDQVLTLPGPGVVGTPSGWVLCAGRHNGARRPRYHVL
jgi:hypothetical protein